MDDKHKIELTTEELQIIHKALTSYGDSVETGSDEYIKLWDLWRRLFITERI